MIVLKDHLVDLRKDLIGQTFPELYQKRRCIRGFLLVSVKADEAGEYSVAAALVQDRIIVEQVGYGPGYACMSVLRQFLGVGMDGESLGSLEKEAEKACTFTADIDLGNTPEADYRVVAFVRRNGRVVNAVTGPLNGKIDYQYENEEDS